MQLGILHLNVLGAELPLPLAMTPLELLLLLLEMESEEGERRACAKAGVAVMGKDLLRLTVR